MIDAKKLSLLCILKILEEHSDRDHRLTQTEIIKILSQQYGISLERKAIARNIQMLQDAGYAIAAERGYYLDERTFSDSELRLLIDSVLGSQHITERETEVLVDGLGKLGNVYFQKQVRKYKNIYHGHKMENYRFFDNIDCIMEAMDKNRQISFMHMQYGLDKELHETHRYEVTPFTMCLHSQHYYLIAYLEKQIGDPGKKKEMRFFRVDRMKDVEILNTPATSRYSIPEANSYLGNASLFSQYPFFFPGEPKPILFLCEKTIISQLVDWFGKDFQVEEMPDGKRLKVRVKASVMAMVPWACEYAESVEILEPESLRNQVKETLENALKKYKKP